MRIRFIPAGIALSAGSVTCLICLLRDYDVLYSLEALLITLLIFTYIGFKAQKIIMYVMHEQKVQEEEAIRIAEWQEAERLRKIEMEKNMDEEEEQEEIEEDELETEN
ncbi:MAG: hypothetical protein K2N51_04015 [Lachnospiraceae bacterium]|nr:hypothetical protein [Lachnospiraceae bacterium]